MMNRSTQQLQKNRPSKTRRFHRKSIGAVTVEVAICLPVLFILLFGCLEMARANMLLHATESAAYEGARVGILPGAQQQSIEDAVNFVLNSVGAAGGQVQTVPAVITDSTQEVEVIVLVPYARNAFVPPFFLSDPTFRATCTLQREIL